MRPWIVLQVPIIKASLGHAATIANQDATADADGPRRMGQVTVEGAEATVKPANGGVAQIPQKDASTNADQAGLLVL